MARREYEIITGVQYTAASGELTVCFANGDAVRIAAAQLPASHKGARWGEATVEEGLHIHVPVAPGAGDLGTDEADVPWDVFRALTDPQFAAEMAQAAARHAREVGATLRTLRQQRGLTAAEVGARAGMSQQGVSRIENGRHDVSFSTLERLLAAMGCNLRDLWDAQSVAGTR